MISFGHEFLNTQDKCHSTNTFHQRLNHSHQRDQHGYQSKQKKNQSSSHPCQKISWAKKIGEIHQTKRKEK